MEIYCFLLSLPKDLFTPYHSSIFRIEITKRDTSFLILVLNFTGADSGFSEGGGDRTLSNCYCCLTSPFSQEKVWSKYLRLFHFRGFDRTTPGSASDFKWLTKPINCMFRHKFKSFPFHTFLALCSFLFSFLSSNYFSVNYFITFSGS